MPDSKPPGSPRSPLPGAQPATRPQGPIAPKIYTPEAKEAARQVAKAEPLVTEGMKAHRREIERKKRSAAVQKLLLRQEAVEGWVRVRRIVLWIAVAVVAVLLYTRLQLQYGNRWPLLAVWIFMGGAILGILGWMLWYMDKGD